MAVVYVGGMWWYIYRHMKCTSFSCALRSRGRLRWEWWPAIHKEHHRLRCFSKYMLGINSRKYSILSNHDSIHSLLLIIEGSTVDPPDTYLTILVLPLADSDVLPSTTSSSFMHCP